MTTIRRILYIIIAWMIVYTAGYAIWMYDAIRRYGPPELDRPIVETRKTVYVVPWPWELVYQDGEMWMRLEIENENR